MQAMLDAAAPRLRTGVKMLSETIRGDVREGDIGTELGEIAKVHPDVSIGSYPFFDDKFGPNTNLVIRSRDSQRLPPPRRRSKPCSCGYGRRSRPRQRRYADPDYSEYRRPRLSGMMGQNSRGTIELRLRTAAGAHSFFALPRPSNAELTRS